MKCSPQISADFPIHIVLKRQKKKATSIDYQWLEDASGSYKLLLFAVADPAAGAGSQESGYWVIALGLQQVTLGKSLLFNVALVSYPTKCPSQL